MTFSSPIGFEHARSPLKILLVSKRLPRADADHAGGQITHYYLDAAVQWATFDLVALATQNETESGVAGVRSLQLIPCALDGTDASSLDGLRIRAVGYARLFRKALELSRDETYDLVLLERSALGWMAPILGRRSRIVLVLHDLWFDRLQSEIDRSGGLKRSYLRLLQGIARRIEGIGATRAQGIIAYDVRTRQLATTHLLKSGGASKPTIVLPPYHREWSRAGVKVVPGAIYFYGNMGRSANWRSAIWFLEEVFPRVQREVVHATFHIVGASPPKVLSDHHDGANVFVTGYLSDPDPILASAEAFVVPLVAGTGIKIKVLEAMASGIPVVGNDIAMQGIPAVPDRDYLHADNPEVFAEQVIRLLSDPALNRRIAAAGQALRNREMNPTEGDRRYREFLTQIADHLDAP